MELLLILTAVGVFSALASLQGRGTWKTVAEEVGLDYTHGWPDGKKLRGDHRGFDIAVDQISDNKQTKIRVTVSGVDPGFTLGRDSAFLRMIKPDIETGDQLFDERTRIEGDADWALALLGDEARRLAEIVISGWNGKVKGDALIAFYDDIQDTPSNLDTILDLAQLLRLPPRQELPKLLEERACHDGSNPVRLQAFRRLAASQGFRERAVETAETLLGAPSDFLRLEASRLLVKSSSEKSDVAAEELMRLATGHWNESSVRRSAIDTLVDSRYRPTAIPALRAILDQEGGPTVVRTAALDNLIHAGAKDELLGLRTDDDVEAEILARGLGRFDASVQPRLLQLLEHSRDRVRTAAATSLGRVGDLDAIRPLRQIAGKDRLFKSALARSAENAITNIKSRFGGSQQGEISIIHVAPLEGAISPSDDSEAGGEVSLTS